MRGDAPESDGSLTGVDLEGFRSVFADADVQYAVLFGSHVSGTASPASDLDVCVRFPDDCTRHERFRRRNQIDSELQSYAEMFVDVSDRQAVPDTVALNALRDGWLVYGDEETKAADERRLTQRVEDAHEQRTRQRREFIDRLATGDV
ncbi:DNA polymerase beta domain-containing protein [Natrialba hulunbeirensis JCM 10989]|uniref:DNA polymerase beta domain-containing protein n=1 Tax=Natrialba hulunbeirensis JCM 10989 TaxID=1227493 RepID=M0AE96_9EURY|nr:nucleotidyltransferase domain-containing protein [Natrialba hulunbeirensis]ELY95658.1 DNA polymerase beta domain-containing protein [Natrialba hulunbeirensis JCM 10989]